jgi:hypothetical protein
MAACLGMALLSGPALAGPCEAQITELATAMSRPTGKESGTLSGSVPDSNQTAAMSSQATTGTTGAAATPGTMGATGKEQGTLAGNAPDGQQQAVDPTGGKATSAQDVQLQQQGMPTMAQGGDPGAIEAQRQQAQASLDRARQLDAAGDAGCRSALDEAQRLFRQGG